MISFDQLLIDPDKDALAADGETAYVGTSDRTLRVVLGKRRPEAFPDARKRALDLAVSADLPAISWPMEPLLDFLQAEAVRRARFSEAVS